MKEFLGMFKRAQGFKVVKLEPAGASSLLKPNTSLEGHGDFCLAVMARLGRVRHHGCASSLDAFLCMKQLAQGKNMLGLASRASMEDASSVEVEKWLREQYQDDSGNGGTCGNGNGSGQQETDFTAVMLQTPPPPSPASKPAAATTSPPLPFASSAGASSPASVAVAAAAVAVAAAAANSDRNPRSKEGTAAGDDNSGGKKTNKKVSNYSKDRRKTRPTPLEVKSTTTDATLGRRDKASRNNKNHLKKGEAEKMNYALAAANGEWTPILGGRKLEMEVPGALRGGAERVNWEALRKSSEKQALRPDSGTAGNGDGDDDEGEGNGGGGTSSGRSPTAASNRGKGHGKNTQHGSHGGGGSSTTAKAKEAPKQGMWWQIRKANLMADALADKGYAPNKPSGGRVYKSQRSGPGPLM
jgi:hypothetical protein